MIIHASGIYSLAETEFSRINSDDRIHFNAFWYNRTEIFFSLYRSMRDKTSGECHQLRVRRALSLLKMFRCEPEGRYHHRLSTAIAPFWFSTEHLSIVIAPFWLSTDDMSSWVMMIKGAHWAANACERSEFWIRQLFWQMLAKIRARLCH